MIIQWVVWRGLVFILRRQFSPVLVIVCWRGCWSVRAGPSHWSTWTRDTCWSSDWRRGERGNGVMNGPVHWMTQTCQHKIVVWKFPDIKYWLPGPALEWVCAWSLDSEQNNNFITWPRLRSWSRFNEKYCFWWLIRQTLLVKKKIVKMLITLFLN